MAIFTVNMNGLPAIEAVDDTYGIDSNETFNLTLPVLLNDSLGFQPTIISNVTDVDTEANVGILSIIDTQDAIGVALLNPGSITTGVFTFTYTITDAFNREDTATVTLEITTPIV